MVVQSIRVITKLPNSKHSLMIPKETTQWSSENKDKRTNKYLQNTTSKTKDRVTRNSLLVTFLSYEVVFLVFYHFLVIGYI